MATNSGNSGNGGAPQAAYREGDRVKGRFVVRAFEGAGPLGERYRAFDEEVEVDVQLRVVHASLLPNDGARRSFRERMQKARALAHANLLRVYAVIDDKGREILAVQAAPGQSLADRLAAGEAAAFESARPLLGQIAAALAHAHHLDLVLGDLRPSTVVALADGVKVTSVGVALSLPREPYLRAVSHHPELSHLAPELRRGTTCDARADVFSFAALALAMLAGDTLANPLGPNAHRRGDLPAALLAVLDRGLDPDPARRHQTVEALLTALDRAVSAGRRRTGPVTLPSSMTGSMAAVRISSPMAAVPEPQPVAAPPREEVTRQVDEEELKRLAGEVSDLLETTRQASLEELAPLRDRSVERSGDRAGDRTIDRSGDRSGDRSSDRSSERTGERSFDRAADRAAASESDFHLDDSFEDAVPTTVGRDPSTRAAGLAATARGRTQNDRARGITGSGPRPRPGLIEEDDDLEFDLGPSTARVEKIADPAAEETRADAPPPRRPMRDGRTPLGFDAVTARPAESAPPPPRVEAAAPIEDPFAMVDDPLAGIDDDVAAARPRIEFQPSHDPFAAALEAAHESAVAVPPPRVRNSGLLNVAFEPPAPVFPPGPLHVPDDAMDGLADTLEPEFFVEDVAPALEPPPRPQLRGESPPSLQPTELVVPAVRKRRREPRDRMLIAIGAGCIALALAAAAVIVTRQADPPPAPPMRRTSTVPIAPPPPGPSAPTVSQLPADPPPTAQPIAPTAAPPAAAATPVAAPTAPTAPTAAAPGIDPPPAAAAAPSRPSPVAAPVVSGARGCPAGMLKIPGLHGVCIDPFEFPGRAAAPRTGVALAQAEQLCVARGGRLCTPKEWEHACRGAGGASYPYGPNYAADLCNTDGKSIAPSGTFAGCRSKTGAYDMSGNAAEWTTGGVVKGGAYGEGNPSARCSHDVKTDGDPQPKVGFRCCGNSK